MKKNLKMTRGDTFSFNFSIDEELDNAYFSAKRTSDKNDIDYIFQKALGSGISLVAEEDNEKTYVVRVAPEDTNEVDKGNYYYDLQLEINGDVFTPIIGKLKITDDVTREV